MDRFADPSAREKDRMEVFKRICNGLVDARKSSLWGAFVDAVKRNNHHPFLFGQLQSRLMVNMAGGVMENAGLCLDRFGLPYLPGSAVKGCARRMATQELLDAEKPEKKAEILFDLALIFGWGDADWKKGRKSKRQDGREIETEPYSDFWWAMSSDTGDREADDRKRQEVWDNIIGNIADRLLNHLCIQKRDHPEDPWRDLGNFAGSVSFLPAYPVDLGRTGQIQGLPMEVPEIGKLELDVVTCHHRDYYSGTLPVATDTEEPVPVVFPAVASGHVFAFSALALPNADIGLASHARSWLKLGLETFGLGAKTNAGYGWFDASDSVQQIVEKTIKDAESKRQTERRRIEEEISRKEEEVERQRKAAERKVATASLTPEQKADYDLAELSDDQFRGRLNDFSKREKVEQESMIRAMRQACDVPGSRRKFWDDLKTKAQKGGKPAQIEQAIRQLSKQTFPGKEGKMP